MALYAFGLAARRLMQEKQVTPLKPEAFRARRLAAPGRRHEQGPRLEGAAGCSRGNALCQADSERRHVHKGPQQASSRQQVQESLYAGRSQGLHCSLQVEDCTWEAEILKLSCNG